MKGDVVHERAEGDQQDRFEEAERHSAYPYEGQASGTDEARGQQEADPYQRPLK